MIDRQLRARVLLGEAHALGLEVADLVAADTDTAARWPTVAGFIEMIAPTFTPATAATYRPYWRLAAARLGDRRLIDITVTDLAAVGADAIARAKKRRPDSPGRASQESCVTALRALFRRAADAGFVTVNPAAALPKPRRARSRRRALDDTELAELVDAVRTTSNDPDLDLLVVRFHLDPAPAAKAPSTSAAATSTTAGPPSGSGRKATANANNQSHQPSSTSSNTTPAPAVPPTRTIPSSGPATARR